MNGLKKEEWVDVNEDLPQIQNGLKYCSMNVILKLEDGRVLVGYFCDHDLCWYTDKSKKIKEEVICWKSVVSDNH